MSDKRPTFDDLKARLEYELAKPPFHRFLRPQALALDAENQSISVLVPFRTDFKFSDDLPGIHGGVISAVVDLSAYATAAVFSGGDCPTVSLSLDFLSGARDADLVSVAKIVKLGRQLCWVQVDISCGDSHVAVAKVLLLIKKSVK